MLTEAIFLIETTDGPQWATLSAVMARLCSGTLTGFQGLAAHQRHGLELFLYQAAAVALARSGEVAAATDDAAWRDLADAGAWSARLAALTPGCADTAWSLVVDDLSRPAFLQPPIPAGCLDGYALAGRTPDEIDVLVTSKSHDVKAARAGAAEVRHWLFALLSVQTLQGYSGRGNFGIARMNGGFGSRPLLMVAPARDLPARFRRGVQAALAARRRALDLDGGYYREDGLPLLWLEPWDSEKGLPLADLDPLFVEVCRRLRLVRDAEGGITAWSRPSEGPRVAVPKTAAGDLGDAWTPVAGGTALTVGPAGFDYRLMTRLLTLGEFTLPAAMDLPPGYRGDVWLHAAVLVRGQGKTEGLHERWLPIPAAARRALRAGPEAETAGQLGKAMVANAGAARTALRLALLAFLQGGGDKLDFKDERPREWLDRLEREVDGIYFPHLFARLAAGEGDAAMGGAAWREALARITRDLFETATTRLSPPESRRERAHAVASLILDRQIRTAGLTQAAQPARLEDAT